MPGAYLKEELYSLVQKDSAIFEFLQSGSLDGIWYWNMQNIDEEWMSPRFWESLGYDPASKPHSAGAWQDIIDPDDRELAIKNAQRHAEDPSYPYDQVVRYRHRDGSTVWIRCRGLIIRDAQGQPVRMLGAHTDITPQMRAQEALRESNRLLQRANLDLEDVSRAVSHDLRAPLRAIEQVAGWIQEDLEAHCTPEIHEHFDLLNARVARAKTLLDRLLRYARAGESTRAPTWFKLDAVIRQVWRTIASKDFEMAVDVLDEPIYGHEDILSQVFQNLLDNAVRHHPDPTGRIEVVGRAMGDRIVVEVRDDGDGIPEQFHTRVFRAFERLKSRDELEGSGLGLAIVKKSVERAGGRLRLSNNRPRGAIFSFDWPIEWCRSLGNIATRARI